HADRLVMANNAQTVNVLQAMILTDPDTGALVTTPTYHVFAMNTPHHDSQELSVHLVGDTFSQNVDGTDLDLLSASASTRDDSALISLTNLDAERERTVVLDLRGREVAGHRARVLTAPTLQTHNTPTIQEIGRAAC